MVNKTIAGFYHTLHLVNEVITNSCRSSRSSGQASHQGMQVNLVMEFIQSGHVGQTEHANYAGQLFINEMYVLYTYNTICSNQPDQ